MEFLFIRKYLLEQQKNQFLQYILIHGVCGNKFENKGLIFN